jgi:hypothetical protein
MMPNNSTNVRTNVPGWAGGLIRLAGAVAPEWTASRMVDRMLQTRRRRPTEAAERFRGTAERIELRVDGLGFVGFATGRGPRVYLLHGWDGSAGDFAELAEALAGAGFRAIALDAPGHGEADGDSANVALFAQTLMAAVQALGAAHGIVGHSMGAASASLALTQGLGTRRLAFVAPEPDPGAYVDALGELGGPRVREHMRGEMTRRVGLAPEDVSLEATLGEVRPLVIHDLRDRQVPFGRVVRQFPSLLRTDGLGHRRILSDPAVIEAVTSFLSSGNERSCTHRYVEGACAQCALEQELYRRSLRAAG